ncbi:GGDEF domain-containing protein [Gracilinema caldarium]|uniref:GGDEF domain-containing protein n=1 Tax=Gracilinema caldarium TaxID=215591 RepID=UPI0026ED6866|nr:GGDEF domain-containing protein [Gracilinema caldarium]
MNTIYLSMLLGNFMTVLLVLSYALHYKDRMINLYIIGKSIECLGFLVAFIRGGVHPFVPIGIGNTLLIAGASCENLAMLSIAGYSSQRLRNIFIIGGIFAVILFNTAFFLGANTSQRIALMSFITIAIVSLSTVKFLADPKASALRKMVGFLYLFVIVGLSLRLYDALRSADFHYFLTSTMFQAIAFLSLSLNQILGTVGFVLIAKEIADRELVSAATTDNLTKILNRRSFRQHAEAALAHCSRSHEPLSFAIMDLDHFKEINDTYGHLAGDEALVSFTKKVSSMIRPYDIFSRFGGEEFALLLPGLPSDAAFRVLERIRKAVESSRFISEKQEKPITVSIGLVSCSAMDISDLDTLYSKADALLYKAKSEGRNRVAVSEASL